MWTCSYCVWTRWATFQISCPSYFSLFLLPPLARDWYLERGIGSIMPTWGQSKGHSYSQRLWNCGEFLIIIRFVRYLPLLWNHVFVWNRLLYNFLLALYHGLWDNRKRTHWKCIFLQKESTWQSIQPLWRWGQNQNNELKKFWSWYISISFLLFVCIFLRHPLGHCYFKLDLSSFLSGFYASPKVLIWAVHKGVL